MNRLILALALSAAAPVYAEAAQARADAANAVVAKAFATPTAPGATPESATPVARLIGWTLGIAAVGALVVMTLKKKQSVKNLGGAVAVAQTVSVGPKRHLLVVTFGDKKLLIGSAEGGFSVLASEPLISASQAAEAAASEFPSLLDDEIASWVGSAQTKAESAS